MSEHLVNSERQNTAPRHNHNLNLRIGAAVVAGAIAGYIGGHFGDKDSQQGVSNLKATEIAQQAVIHQRDAALLADSYTQRLTESTHPKGKILPVFMQYLNGNIQVVTPPGAHKGGPPETYKDPIILSLANPEQQPDKNGNFLIGSWIGIESSSSAGSVVIEPVPYSTSGSMRFVPNSPNNPKNYIESAGVYAQSYDNGHGQTIGYELIAYDVTGNRFLHNADGSSVTPGRIEPQ